MAEKIDFATLWRKACAGTSFGQPETSDLLRKLTMQVLVKNPPNTTVAYMADRLRNFISGMDQRHAEQARIVAAFLRSLPPGTAIKTVVGGLWI